MKCDFCREEIDVSIGNFWGRIVERNGRRPLCLACIKTIRLESDKAILERIFGR